MADVYGFGSRAEGLWGGGLRVYGFLEVLDNGYL